MEDKINIAIQGNQGSFHHVVAKEYYKRDFSLVVCETFDDTVKALLKGTANQAVMAIENSIAGSIIPNYALIDRNQLKIVGEYGLSIHHQLMALSGQNIEDIKEVHSHPMALLQCKDFFHQHPHIRLVEAEDTADEARRIAENQLEGIGAIASQEAADLYGMEVVASSIQTIKNNVTRFVIIQSEGHLIAQESINKAALKFILDHQRGSLAAVLNVMSDCQLNLTKIQSLPVIETPGKYAFFVDVTFEDFTHYEKARQLIAIMASEFKILGEYAQHQR
jgi:prephenate dehydratase